MFRIFWTLAVLQIFEILQVNPLIIPKVVIDDLSGFTSEELSGVISEEQLPDAVIPTSYVLDIFPMPEDAYFKGRVTIGLLWQEESNKIVLHAHPDLVIYQSELVLIENDAPPKTIKILRSEKDPDHSWYICHIRKALPAGTQGKLSMSFTGKLDTDAQRGLYLSTYEDSSSEETKYFVGSYLKPNYARQVFPCFDEPRYKTPFTVSIVRKNSMTSLSNMPLLQSEILNDDPDWTRDYFEESHAMATHSLGIIVSDFVSSSVEESIEGDRNFGASIKIWTKSDQFDLAQNYSETLFKAINNVGAVFGFPYPLPKLDFVLSEGLEANNFGLIVQRNLGTPSILYNVVSQWLGQLVTPALWKDSYLNQGLVSFIIADIMSQEEPVDEMFPNLYALIQEYSEENNYEIIGSLKFAMVFRMFNYTLGAATLQQSLQRFISEREYNTYVESDLWNAITEQAHLENKLKEDLDINTIAESWILENRLPILTVKRNYRDNSATFTQQANINSATDTPSGEADHKWFIPIALVKQNNLDFSNTFPLTWLQDVSVRLTKMGSRDNFIIVNPEDIAPVSVNYDERNWKLLTEFLKTEEREKIPFFTRSKLVHDALYFAKRGDLSYKVALDMALFLENEENYVVWNEFLTANEFLMTYISESQTAFEKYLHFVRLWLSTLYERLEGVSEENDVTKLYIKRSLCELGYLPCIEEAKTGFDNWIEFGPVDCAMTTLSNICYIFRWGTDEDFELGLSNIDTLNETVYGVNQQFVLTNLIHCADKQWKVEKILNITIFERVEDYSDSDIENIVINLKNKYKSLFEYLVQNWEALRERFDGKEELWKTLIQTATSNFRTHEGLELIKNLYSEKRDEFGSAESTIQEALEVVEKEVERSAVNYPVIEEWVDNYLSNHNDNIEEKFVVYEP